MPRGRGTRSAGEPRLGAKISPAEVPIRSRERNPAPGAPKVIAAPPRTGLQARVDNPRVPRVPHPRTVGGRVIAVAKPRVAAAELWTASVRVETREARASAVKPAVLRPVAGVLPHAAAGAALRAVAAVHAGEAAERAAAAVVVVAAVAERGSRSRRCFDEIR